MLTTVPRQYVHKTAETEALLRGWQQDGENAFLATSLWPQAHSFYRPGHGLHDPMLFSESVRQAIPLVSHAGYGAPMDHRQIWDTYRCAVFPDALRHEPVPAACSLRLSGTDVVMRSGRLSRMTLTATATRGDQHLGIAETQFTNHAPAIYQRLRGAGNDAPDAMARAVPLPAPIAPDQVGRIDPQDVVLAPGRAEMQWQLRVDVTHPVLFDHPVDHVPGMVLLEAARQAAHATMHPRPTVLTSLNARFTHFVEFDTPCWITAEQGPVSAPGYETVRITARQGDHVPFAATVTSLVVSP
ncbi:ScbA/BarX family gamma-butyrolactone biosynthesis protein [Streptomyces sp. cg35]|uniref:ScbA/BarX family gamma-butyrolactone biosynthesis protein n=1 Tax=Streptomyces sp. cg35 TaxID=3421650 RepID=UPI003D16397A